MFAADGGLNIPPDEHELLGTAATDLAVLLRLIIEVKEYVKELNKNPSRTTEEKNRRISAHLDKVSSS